MDNSWINYLNRLSNEYANGVHTFIKIAWNYFDSDGNTHCPYRMCLNVFFKSLSVVEKHFFMNGFLSIYEIWIFMEIDS